MASVAQRSATPWHLWLIGGLSLLWNGFGGYDFVMSQTRNLEYMRAMTEPYGFDAQIAVNYFDSFPIWADAAWALGVWGSVIGSALLLMRSRYAFHAFVASLVGLILAFVHQYANPMPGLTDSALAIGMSAMIAIVIVLLAWYARIMTRREVLR